MITPLHLAAFGFFNEAGRELISLGADLNIKVSLELEQGKHKIFLFFFFCNIWRTEDVLALCLNGRAHWAVFN